MKGSLTEEQARDCWEKIPLVDRRLFAEVAKKIRQAQYERLQAEQERNRNGRSTSE